MTSLTFTASPYHLGVPDNDPEKVAVQDALARWLKAVGATDFRHLANDFGFSVTIAQMTSVSSFLRLHYDAKGAV